MNRIRYLRTFSARITGKAFVFPVTGDFHSFQQLACKKGPCSYCFKDAGGRLSFHTVSGIVFSAARVLTIVFGMGTGVSPGRIATSKFCRHIDGSTVKHILCSATKLSVPLR